MDQSQVGSSFQLFPELLMPASMSISPPHGQIEVEQNGFEDAKRQQCAQSCTRRLKLLSRGLLGCTIDREKKAYGNTTKFRVHFADGSQLELDGPNLECTDRYCAVSLLTLLLNSPCVTARP